MKPLMLALALAFTVVSAPAFSADMPAKPDATAAKPDAAAKPEATAKPKKMTHATKVSHMTKATKPGMKPAMEPSTDQLNQQQLDMHKS